MSLTGKVFNYNEHDFVYETSWSNPNITKFDECVNNYWNFAMDNNYFRFKLNIKQTKQLQGRFGFIAQCNPDRGLKRRKPQDIESMDDQFDPNRFNFTQIPDKEIILELKQSQGGVNVATGRDLLAINVSPLAESHCLLLPQVDLKLPQVLTFHASKLALHTLLLSGTPSLRLGFNSLCGFASVNHLHLHSFLLPNKMVLETISLKQLAGPCYEIDQFVIKGFAFQSELQSCADILTLARNTFKLTQFLQNRKIAHNVVWIRSGDPVDEIHRKKVRVFVWARQYSYDEKEFEAVTEESASKTLDDITSSVFSDIKIGVRDLFSRSEL